MLLNILTETGRWLIKMFVFSRFWTVSPHTDPSLTHFNVDFWLHYIDTMTGTPGHAPSYHSLYTKWRQSCTGLTACGILFCLPGCFYLSLELYNSQAAGLKEEAGNQTELWEVI